MITGSRAATHLTASPTRTRPTAHVGLRYAALVFLAGFLLHNADHFRRGLDVLTPEVLWAGTLSGLVTLAAIALMLFQYQRSPAIAVIVGFGMALGVSIVHLLPHRPGRVYFTSIMRRPLLGAFTRGRR